MQRAPSEQNHAVRISQQRIQRLHTHLVGVPKESVITPALLDLDRHARRLWDIGLPPHVGVRRSVLPPEVGPRTRYNATGARGSSGRPPGELDAPCVRLRVAERSGAPWAVVGERQRRGADDDRLLHSVNLFLELFGECDLLWEPARGAADAPGPVRSAALV